MTSPAVVNTSGGRFDFDDGGTYCGGWEDGKAHGHGICTGPKGQGQFCGSWHYGFEVSGVYTWPSGSGYEGQWQNGKRHGLGVETRGRWLYRGEWTQGYKGRYGIRQSLTSGAKYEGTWANGLQDGYGSETYADGGTFQGQWLRGYRHGYGVRSSAPFGLAVHSKGAGGPGSPNPDSVATSHPLAGSFSSLHGSDIQQPVDPASDRDHKMNEGRGGFVLKSRSDDVPQRRRSLGEKSGHIKRSLLQGLRIKKQYSTGDIDKRGTGVSLRGSGSNMSSASSESSHSAMNHLHAASSYGHNTDSNASWVSQEDITDHNVIETYMGEWKNDKRCGYGIAERSDGLKYEGEWYNNKKYGYGVTSFKDGSREEGKYKNNVLVTSGKKKHLFLLRSAKFKERIEQAVGSAVRASQIALQKADIAISRTATARGKAEQADIAAMQARQDAELAQSIAKQFAPELYSPHDKLSEDISSRLRLPNLAAGGTGTPQRKRSLFTVGSGPSQPPLLNHKPHLGPPSRQGTPPTSFQQQLTSQLQQQFPQFSANQPPGTGGSAGPGNPLGSAAPYAIPRRDSAFNPQQQQQFQQQTQQSAFHSFQDTNMPQVSGAPEPPPRTPHGSVRRRGHHSASRAQHSGYASGALNDRFDHYQRASSTSRPPSRSRGVSQSPTPRSFYQQQQPPTQLPSAVFSGANAAPSQETLPSLSSYYGPAAAMGGGAADCTPDSGVSESMDGDDPNSPTKGGNVRRSTLPSVMDFVPAQFGFSGGGPGSTVGGGDTSSVGSSGGFHRTASLYIGGGGAGGPRKRILEQPAAESLSRKKSLPNIADKLNAPPVMTREEVNRLSHERRVELRSMQEQAERLRTNPLLYLFNPDVKDWFSRQQLVMLVLFINISLALLFLKLLT